MIERGARPEGMKVREVVILRVEKEREESRVGARVDTRRLHGRVLSFGQITTRKLGFVRSALPRPRRAA